MNYCCFIVRVIKNPIQTYYKQNISATEIIAEFRFRKKLLQIKPLKISFWSNNNNINSILKFCKINNYIIVYGKIFTNKNKQIEMSVTKIIPISSL